MQTGEVLRQQNRGGGKATDAAILVITLAFQGRCQSGNCNITVGLRPFRVRTRSCDRMRLPRMYTHLPMSMSAKRFRNVCL